MTRLPVAHLSALWAAVVVPSAPTVLRFGGLIGLIGYAVLVAIVIAIAPQIRAHTPLRHIRTFVGLTTVAIVIVFALVYPRVNVQIPDAGSDDDDAHNVGVVALLDGESPYGRVTYLGNELHQLPGAYVLAAPFVLAGTSALQNLVCLPLFYWLLRARGRDARSALVVWWLVTVVSVAVDHAVVTGSSYAWSAIWIALSMHLVVQHPRSSLATIFFATAICSRPNVALLALPLLAFLWRTHGAAVAGRALATIAMTFAILVLPFRPWGPDFGPAEGYSRLAVLDELMPGLGLVVLLLTLAITVAAAAKVKSDEGLFGVSALILAVPVIAGVLLGSAISADVMWSFAPYGLFVPWFLVIANGRVIDPWLEGEFSSPALRR